MITPIRLAILSCLMIFAGQAHAVQNVWTQKHDLPPFARDLAMSFSLDLDSNGVTDHGYVCGGYDQVSTSFQDLWQYNPGNDTWTQLADMDGGKRSNGLGFGIDYKGYIGGGTDALGNFLQDFWEYNAHTNTWTQKSNLPGTSGRWAGFGIGANHKGYVGLGNYSTLGNPDLQADFWEYKPLNDTWTALPDFPGGGRINVTGFVLGDTIYVGTGWGANGVTETFWGYERTSNAWTVKASLPGVARINATVFAMGGKGYVGTGVVGSGAQFTTGFLSDFYAYNPATGAWTAIADYPVGKIDGTFAFSIADSGYVVGGNDSGTVIKSVYKYGPQLPTGIHDVAEDAINIFPNPASDIITITTSSAQPSEVFIYSINGSIVKHEKTSGTNTQVDISSLAQGTYMVELKTGNRSITKKLVKL